MKVLKLFNGRLFMQVLCTHRYSRGLACEQALISARGESAGRLQGDWRAQPRESNRPRESTWIEPPMLSSVEQTRTSCQAFLPCLVAETAVVWWPLGYVFRWATLEKRKKRMNHINLTTIPLDKKAQERNNFQGGDRKLLPCSCCYFLEYFDLPGLLLFSLSLLLALNVDRNKIPSDHTRQVYSPSQPSLRLAPPPPQLTSAEPSETFHSLCIKSQS